MQPPRETFTRYKILFCSSLINFYPWKSLHQFARNSAKYGEINVRRHLMRRVQSGIVLTNPNSEIAVGISWRSQWAKGFEICVGEWLLLIVDRYGDDWFHLAGTACWFASDQIQH